MSQNSLEIGESLRRIAMLSCGPVGEVGQGALAGFLALAEGLAEEDGGRGVAVGNDVDVHGRSKSAHTARCQHKY